MAGLTPRGDYVTLPKFVHVGGTLGSPGARTDKAVITGLIASGVAGQVGGKLGNALKGLGGFLTPDKPTEKAPTQPVPTPTPVPAPKPGTPGAQVPKLPELNPTTPPKKP